ncbi:DUF1284 domain-containing protein [Brevibacillus daliensis]|uniref:DUF1284 domain-containing protein n=1 Tax=Brevibacillus daliensis TaxID=2892995 RepID=UPI001E2E561B|nr:DUF1284 domain-containing protein [Brevibacillus daliensis]
MGYSPAFITSMRKIVEGFRDDTLDFTIRVLNDLDDTCQVCPHKGQGICEASEGSEIHVQTLDQAVINHLQLKSGQLYRKSEVVERVKKRVVPDDLDQLCKGCSWLRYGVCKEGIDLLKKGEYLTIQD